MPKLIKELHYYISNDTSHDTIFVQQFFIMHWKFLLDQGCIPTEHIMWSDGCSEQFKNNKAWYFLSHYPSLTTYESCSSRCKMIWNFFAIGHVKGEVDGSGALLKREIRKEQIKPLGQKLKNAREVAQFFRA
jgi:hypothetical protein